MDPRAQATQRLQAKRRFSRHALIYAVVIGLLVSIWALTNFGNYFWPIWPALVWGIALAPSMPGRSMGSGPSPRPTSTAS
jgi:2TM domain